MNRPARVLVLALVGVLALSACGDTFHPPAATVNGVRISDDQLQADLPLYRFLGSLRQQPCGQPQKGESLQSACARFVLGNLIQERLIDAYAGVHHLRVQQAAVSRSIASLAQSIGGRSALAGQLRLHHLSEGRLEALAKRFLLFNEVAAAVARQEIPEAELRSEYAQTRLTFTELHAAHILVPNRGTAQRIARRATPANFADLARRFSKDPGSAARGGDLGTIPASRLDAAFVKAALALRPGRISRPVHTRFGWHVIRLISVSVVPYAQARVQLLRQDTPTAFTSWLKARTRSGDITVNPRYGRFDPATGQILVVRSTAETP